MFSILCNFGVTLLGAHKYIIDHYALHFVPECFVMITDFPCTSMAFSFVAFYGLIEIKYKKEKNEWVRVYDIMW